MLLVVWLPAGWNLLPQSEVDPRRQSSEFCSGPPLFELEVLAGKARQQLWETEGPIPSFVPLEV